jgi:hypothetical protein
MSSLRRKRNLLADRCAIFEANANSDSQSGSFLTNLARRRTTNDAVKDDSTQATMDISENSSNTFGSGSLSASARRSSLTIETMNAIGEDSISDNMYEHIGPPIHITRKRVSVLSGMNVSDVTFEPMSPQVSSSNLFQNSLDDIHQPVTDAPAKDKIVVSPSKRRSELIANRASVFEGCSSPPSGLIFAQSKFSERSVKKEPSAQKSIQQIQHGVAPLRKSEKSEYTDTEKSEQPRRRTIDKEGGIQHIWKSKAIKSDEEIVEHRRQTSNKQETPTDLNTLSKALESKANLEKQQHITRRPKSTKSDSESHIASIILISRKKSQRCDTKSSNVSDVSRPATPRIERSTNTKESQPSPRHTIHNCSPIIRKAETGSASQASPRVKSTEQRKAMLKKLLKIKRNSAPKAV